MFAENLRAERSPLVSYYGAIAGLQELGPEVIKVLIVPIIKAVSVRIDQAAEGGSLVGTTNVEKITTNIRNKLIQGVTPIIKAQRAPPDNIDEFGADFGSIGAYLYQSVVRSRGAAVAQGTGLTPKVIQQQQPQQAQPSAVSQPRPPVPAAVAASPAQMTPQRVYVVPTTPGQPQPQGVHVVQSPQVQHQQRLMYPHQMPPSSQP